MRAWHVLTLLLAMAALVCSPCRTAWAQSDEGGGDDASDDDDDDDDERRPDKTGFHGHIETDDGLALDWDLATSILIVRANRDAAAPARDRVYAPTVEAFPGNYGLVVHVSPPGSPWELGPAGSPVDIISFTLTLLARVNVDRPAQSEVLLGLGLSFFERTVTFAIGVDLYRGIPALGHDEAGVPLRGAATAPTGLFGWAVGTEGEVTAENFCLLLNLDLVSLGSELGAAASSRGDH